ncbi:MAG: nucleotide exchange factor GrpE [bacterium]|nr:nucleotide exchange factor GrpE [bacterium]
MENPFKKNVELKQDTTEETEVNNESEISGEVAGANDESKIEEVVNDVENEEHSQKNEWQGKYEALNNQYIRLAADFDNFRKRQVQERENMLKYGAENTIKNFLEVIDNFDRGLSAIETMDDCEKLKECYKLAYKNFQESLTKVGLETIKSIGEEFDPNMHEAVMQTPTDEYKENTIIAELQKGYLLGDKVIRPALVNVAAAK